MWWFNDGDLISGVVTLLFLLSSHTTANKYFTKAHVFFVTPFMYSSIIFGLVTMCFWPLTIFLRYFKLYVLRRKLKYSVNRGKIPNLLSLQILKRVNIYFILFWFKQESSALLYGYLKLNNIQTLFPLHYTHNWSLCRFCKLL